jgi:hypothetical protein
MLMVPAMRGALGAGVAAPPVFRGLANTPAWVSFSNTFLYPTGTQFNDVVFQVLEVSSEAPTLTPSFNLGITSGRWQLYWKYCSGENHVIASTSGASFAGWTFAYSNCFIGTTPIVSYNANSYVGPPSGSALAPALINSGVDGCLQFDLFAQSVDQTSLGGVTLGSGFTRRSSASYNDDVGIGFFDFSDAPFPVGSSLGVGRVLANMTSVGSCAAMAVVISSQDPGSGSGGTGRGP